MGSPLLVSAERGEFFIACNTYEKVHWISCMLSIDNKLWIL